MKIKLALILAFLLGVASGPARCADKPVELIVEGRTTLRVGESAMLRIPPDRRYAHFRGSVAAGSALALIRRSGRKVLYRAVQPGNSVIIIGPEVPRGECISCATLHYFVTVVPQKSN